MKNRAIRRVATIVTRIRWGQRSVARTFPKIRAAVDEKCGQGREFINAMIDEGAALLDLDKLKGKGRDVPDYLLSEVLGIRAGGGPQAQRGRAGPPLRWA